MEEDIALLNTNRKTLDLMTTFHLYKQSLLNKKFSYLPYLVDIHTLALEAKKKGHPVSSVNQMLMEMGCETIEDEHSWNKIDRMTTLGLIQYADSIFEDKKMNNNHLQSFKDELLKRNDLFECFMSFIEEVGELKSELYFWQPDLEICDISSLVLSLFNIKELIAKYKNYMKKCFMLGEDLQESLLGLLKVRYKLPLYLHIDIMKRDMILFSPERLENCQNRIVSHNYWCDECFEYKDGCNAIKEQLGLDLVKDHGDFSLVFRPCLSYVEVEFTENLTLIIPVSYLDDFINGCKVYKTFWYEKCVIDADGNLLIKKDW